MKKIADKIRIMTKTLEASPDNESYANMRLSHQISQSLLDSKELKISKEREVQEFETFTNDETIISTEFFILSTKDYNRLLELIQLIKRRDCHNLSKAFFDELYHLLEHE